MELIKQIKEAESQAKEIIEQARADATAIGEDSRRKQAEQMSAAQRERTEAVGRAVAQAEAAGTGEAESLKTQAAQERQQLQQTAGAKVDECVERVMGYLRQMH